MRLSRLGIELISKIIAKTFAEEQFEKFRKIQDPTYVSDFDKVAQGIKDSGSLPIEKYDSTKFKGSFTVSIKEEYEKQKKLLEDKKDSE